MPDYADVLNETLPPLSGSSYIDKMLEARSTEPTKPAQGPSEADLKIGDYHRAFSQDAEKRWGPGSPAYVADRVPALGTVKAIDDVLRLREAAKAHQAGNPSDEDLQIIGHHLAKSEYEGSRTGVGQRALDLFTHLPALVAEWAATGGAGGAGRVAATKLATRMGLKAAEGIGARALARGAIGAAGEALARTPLMPSTYGAIAANTVGQDEQGNIVPKNIGTAALKGAASSLVMNTLFSATGQWGLDRPAATTAMGFAKDSAGGLGKAMGAMHGGQEINYQLGAVDSPSAVHEYLSKGDPAARNQLLAEMAVFGGMEAFLHAKATIKARAEKMRAVGLDPTAPANQAKIAAEIEPLVKNPDAAKEAQPATDKDAAIAKLKEDGFDVSVDPKTGKINATSTTTAGPTDGEATDRKDLDVYMNATTGKMEAIDKTTGKNLLDPSGKTDVPPLLGWKLHLATDSPEAVSAALKQLGMKHKVGRSGQEGKDLTVYIGSKDAAQQAADAIEAKAGHLLKKPHGETLGDDIPFSPKVMGRFDISSFDRDFHQYGAGGIPFLNADTDPFNKQNWPGREQRADAALKTKYGEFYTGKQAAGQPRGPLHDMTPEEMVAATSPVEKAPDEPPAVAPRLRAERVALARAAAGLPPEETPVPKIEPPAAPPETKAPVAETPSAPAEAIPPSAAPPEPPQAPATAPTAAERAMARKRQQSMGLKPVEPEAAATAGGEGYEPRPRKTVAVEQSPVSAEGGPPEATLTPMQQLDRDLAVKEATGTEFTPAEKEILRARIEGGRGQFSFRKLGDKYGVSRTTIQNWENAALAKLGREGSIDKTIVLPEIAKREEAAKEKAGFVEPKSREEVAAARNAGIRKMTYDEVVGLVHDELTDEILKAGKNVTPEQSAEFERRFAEADREASRLIERAKQKTGGSRATDRKEVSDAGERGPTEPPADAKPGAGVEPRLPEGMGAAGGGGQAGVPEPGTLGAASAGPQEPPETAAAIKRGLLGRTADFFRSFAGQAFPALTRESQTAGEKLVARDNSDKAAKSTWEYIGQMVKVNGTPLADMTPEQHRFIGSVWLERRMREYRDFLNRSGQVSGNVRTLVGQEGSSLPTEADYQEGLRTLWPFFEAIKQEWTPIVDKNFRGLTGLEPDEMINARSQIPGLPLNAIAMKAEDVGKPGVVSMGGRKQGFENQKIRNPGYTQKAELNAEAYDTDISHMMQRTLNTSIKASRTAEFMRASLADGVIKEVPRGEQAPEGYRDLGLRPAHKLEGIDPNSDYYAHPNAFKDIVQGLGIGERPGQAVLDGLKTISQPIYNIALMAPVELATHIANHFTALFKDGMKTPILNLKDSFTNAWGIWKKDPEMLRKVMNLANIGASFGHEVKPGLLESLAGKEVADKYFDPTRWLNRLTGGIIDTMQKAVRLQLDAAYDRVADAKGIEKSDTGRRDFINQAVGNYSSQANNRLTQLLKDSGLQAFATAAHTFTSQGVKTATLQGNLRGENLSNTAALMAVRAIKLMPVLAMGPVINYLQWGQSFPDDVPDFAIKTGDEGGKVKYFDPLTFTGLRRGAKVIGTNAIVSNMIHGDKTAGQVLDQARRESLLSLTHLFEGPPVQVAKMAATGEGYGGRKVAEQVSKADTPQGIARARALGKPEPGSSQTLLDLKAAALSVNPMVASFAGVDRPKTPRTFAENVGKMLGPFGVKDREKKLTPKERRAMGLK